jgi:hypothetical protein
MNNHLLRKLHIEQKEPYTNGGAVYVPLVANDFECYARMLIRYLTLHMACLRNNFYHKAKKKKTSQRERNQNDLNRVGKFD